MLVLTGPPGSGKTHEVLESIRAALGRGASDFRLIVPTATMAEHLRNKLARKGFLLRPGLIVTLSRFVAAWVEDFPEVSSASLHFLVDRVLAQSPPAEFARVAHLPGFRASVARLIDELGSAGCDSRKLARTLDGAAAGAPLAPPFLAVYQGVEKELLRRGWPAGAARLKSAAEEIRSRGLPGIRQVFFDGFFTLSEPELNLIDAIHSHAGVTVVLPSWHGSERARLALAALGLSERLKPQSFRSPRTVLVSAATLDQEIEEIARRILEHIAAGRQFRDIGIVLRSYNPYVPVLRSVLERFGIPVRFYFSEPLASHPVIRYLTGAVNAMQNGWDHEQTLEVVRMPASGFGNSPACDRFDFVLRERLPGRGLRALGELCDDMRLGALLDRLAGLDAWRASRALPQEWAKRVKALRSLVEAPPMEDGVAHETALRWRSEAAALESFDAAIDEAAGVLPEKEPLPFSEFWRAAMVIVAESPLRVEDKRHNVVHVMDVYEARQWELPVVFVCGLLEKQFPVYHWADPIFPDSARACLERAGLPLKTIADQQREEEFLFEVAATRATEELVLSYPQFNAKGDRNLPSFFLERFRTLEPEKARMARPLVAAAAVSPVRDPYLREPALIEAVRARHAVLRATSLETFLQCPFLFFLADTLCLEEPPARPGDRLGPKLEGSIVHQVLAEFERGSAPLEAVFERVFAEACRDARVPAGCRTELARLKLLRDLRRCVNSAPRLQGWRSLSEEDIRFALADGIEISGRIDRYDVSSDGHAVVFDFKYSGAQGIRKRIRGHQEGRFVQAALYLIGLRERFGCAPAGMFYCGLRGQTTLGGWHTGLPGFEKTGTLCTPEALEEQLEAARIASLRAAGEIRRGRVEPSPEDRDLCEYCAYMDACRFAPEMNAVASEGAAR